MDRTLKQIFQSFRTGQTILEDVPCPRALPGHVLIRTHATLISPGTERMLVEFGKGSLLSKARQQPDKVRQVIDKARSDGLLPTLEAVQAKLDHLIPLGYCNVGTVVDVGSGVADFSIGDRVVSNGAHAEMIVRPVNLCCKIPERVSDDDAAFTVVAAIALQGVRLAQPTLGECVVVSGLGLIGLLTVQLLRAHGCRVLGIDIDPAKLDMARSFGAEVLHLTDEASVLSAAHGFSRGRGVDAVIITASTRSNEPVHQAARVCRKRGRIVLVGVTGLELSRDDFYEKELTFQVSCSYGPGRYDPNYEEGGQDYPAGFVRWTAQRNFEAALDMMADGRLVATQLVSHRFSLASYDAAYAALQNDRPLGIVIEYPSEPGAEPRLYRRSVTVAAASAQPRARLAFIGAGNHASRSLMPAFAETRAGMSAVIANSGVNAVQAARKFKIAEVSTDLATTLRRPDIDAVVIATRHDSHASLILQALSHGKHVFVEKPLCTTFDQLSEIERAYAALQDRGEGVTFLVGFNRRFAPHVVRMQSLLAGSTAPKAIVITVNAGAIPSSHWTQDADIGGGRIIGEACHYIDLARFLAGAAITSVSACGLGTRAAGPADNATIALRFADGSMAQVIYLANGHRAFPKERVEVFTAGRVLQLDNFRILRGFGWSGFRTMRLWRQDKGINACAAAFVDAIADGRPSPIPAAEVFEVAQATLEAADQLARGEDTNLSAAQRSMMSAISLPELPRP
jgi:predicted dehydrogenase/threonine dehydrogenase-like Zn-dependent dehydrogenase